MSGGGGKGGSTTQSIKLDPRLEEGAANAVAGALRSAGLDYSPNRGETIAAFTPQQLAAFQGANQAAAAFGVPTSRDLGIPAPTQSASGVMGYSTAGQYDMNRALSITPEQRAERQGITDYYSRSGQNIAEQTNAGAFTPGASMPGVSK